MSVTTVDLLDLLTDDPTFDENDEPLEEEEICRLRRALERQVERDDAR